MSPFVGGSCSICNAMIHPARRSEEGLGEHSRAPRLHRTLNEVFRRGYADSRRQLI